MPAGGIIQCRYAAEWAAVEWFQRKGKTERRIPYIPPSDFEFQVCVVKALFLRSFGQKIF
jgi:hypothetical protein